jgi:hypothetical protein
MKKIFLIAIVALFYAHSYAYEGVIEQVYTDPTTMEQKTFVWYIKGDKVRLDIKSGEESMTIIPDFKALSLKVFGSKADADGNYWYSNTALSQIETRVENIRILEKTEGANSNELKVLSSQGLYVVEYLPSIDVNIQNMKNVFAESVEFNAIFKANEFGFPINSLLTTQSEAIYTLVTKSQVAKSLSDSDFLVPSSYKLFTGIK